MKRIISFLILILIGFNSYSQQPVNVTFSVDMSLYPTNFTNVEFYRGGQFYNMTNTGNNVYEFNTLVPGFQHQVTLINFQSMVMLRHSLEVNPVWLLHLLIQSDQLIF